ncbi:MAG: ZIP family metal transporter [Gemmatimonadaceae bacterium]|nr:ZIP family metal transporter [Gemmatimonadaceae bacterium]
MSAWWNTLGSIAVVTGVPLGLVALLASSGRRLSRVLPILVAFGAGALIGAAVFHLLPEAYSRTHSSARVALSVVAGAIGSYLLERLLHRWQDTHHEAPAKDPSLASFDDASMVALNFIADGLHNFVDGALIAAAFLAGTGPGLATTVAMLSHELPRELGTFSVFVHYGATPRRAVWYNVLSGALAFLGAGLTLVLGEHTSSAAELLVPVAAGTFLFVGGTVILSVMKSARTRGFPIAQLCAGAAGLVLSALATLWI